MSEIIKYFSDGGPFMYVIAFTSAVALAIIVERMVQIYTRYSISGESFMAQVQKFVVSDNIDRAIKLCNSNGAASLAVVLKAGLLKANENVESIQNGVDEAVLEVLPKLQQRTPYLATIANVATLLGLLGTISGLIRAFGSLQLDDVASRTNILAQGISIAMYTTAFGLMVAIPCMICHGILQGRTVKIIEEIDQYSVKLINLLSIRLSSKSSK